MTSVCAAWTPPAACERVAGAGDRRSFLSEQIGSREETKQAQFSPREKPQAWHRRRQVLEASGRLLGVHTTQDVGPPPAPHPQATAPPVRRRSEAGVGVDSHSGLACQHRATNQARELWKKGLSLPCPTCPQACQPQDGDESSGKIFHERERVAGRGQQGAWPDTDTGPEGGLCCSPPPRE